MLSRTRDNASSGWVWGYRMTLPKGGRVPGLFDEQAGYAALDAIDQALEQA